MNAAVSITLPDEAATRALGDALAVALPEAINGWMLLLQGELGAGKSTLARAMLHALGHSGPVPSPTYTLVEPYEPQGKVIYHVDLYRVADVEELEFLGWQDLREGMILLEWPERAPALRAEADLLIELRYAGDARSAVLTAFSARAEPVLHGLAAMPGVAVG